MRSRRRLWVRHALVTLLVALVLLELVCFVGVQTLAAVKPDLFYVPSVVDRQVYERYRAERDPVVGWPRPGGLGRDSSDAVGSRIVPAFPDPRRSAARVSLYGDSMTESLEVGDAEAWGNQLALLIGERVANFGVAGYGTDQAYLRFVGNEQDEAPIVFLNHFTDDVMRNVNQWRYLLSISDASRLGLKPRFVVDGEGTRLELVPLPALPYDEYVACTWRPARCLPHEFFLPDDGRSGVATIRFPYVLTLLGTLDNTMIRSKLRGEPRHLEFYRRDHPSDAERVTRYILRDFVAAARARGKVPVVTIIPDGKDLEYARAHGAWSYRPLLEDVARDDIEVLDFGPAILSRLAGASPCTIVNRCYDHFNAAGYRMLAEIAHEYLTTHGLVGRAPP
jgi:hypothetical protein